jgi:hypothetical protein
MADSSNTRTALPNRSFNDAKLQRPNDSNDHSAGETPTPDVWYYADQRGRKGPFNFQELKDKLATLQNAEYVLVWANHLGDWKRAREIPEFTRQTTAPIAAHVAAQVSKSNKLQQDEPARPSADITPADTADRGGSVEHTSVCVRSSSPVIGGDLLLRESAKPTRKWFVKIETREDALKIIKYGSIVGFVAAAFLAVRNSGQ